MSIQIDDPEDPKYTLELTAQQKVKIILKSQKIHFLFVTQQAVKGIQVVQPTSKPPVARVGANKVASTFPMASLVEIGKFI